jgi:hypothetical protein
MKNVIAGIDTSVSSPTTTVSLKESQENLRSCAIKEMKEKPGSAVDLDYIPKFDEVEIPADDGPLVDEDSATLMLNAIVTPNLKNLLRSTLRLIEASIPNKDQSKAVKHLVRRQFDDAFVNINRRLFPRNEIIQLTTLPPSDDSYVLDI